MAAGTRLQLKLGQKLKLSPQLRQAIRLLQLNRVELRGHLRDLLETNPLLERESDNPDVDTSDGDTGESAQQESANVDGEEEIGWNDLPEGFSMAGERPNYDEFIGDRATESLQHHLLWQANLAGFSDQDETIARAIIYALDEDGYLHDDLDTLRSSLAPEHLVGSEEVAAVLERVQHFEPIGVACRSVQECLLVQLRARPSGTPWRGLAEHIVENHLEILGRQDLGRLASLTGFDHKAIEAAVSLIRSLDPHPGSRFGSDDENYLVPDVYVHPHGDGWRITLNPENNPGLCLNDYYVRLASESRGEDRQYLNERLQEARWLISGLEMRNQTLLAVTRVIMQRQTSFLKTGDVGMQPLTQREVAVSLNIHESTVSRATTQKYAHTPRGTFELKHFFSAAVPTRDGGRTAATAVKARITRLIAAEIPDRPSSDQALTDQLAADGILLARRTVAKYREQLGIPGSAARRRRVRFNHSPAKTS